MNQVVIEETSFEEVLSEIEENSKYKRRQADTGWFRKIILNAEKSQDRCE